MPHTNSGAHCTFLVSAKDGVPYEEFETEYKKHMVKATPILKKYGATYYSIQFNSPASQAAAASTLGLDTATANQIFLQHEAVTTIKFPDLAALKSFLDSPENKELLDPDGPRFTSEERRRISIGTEWFGFSNEEN